MRKKKFETNMNSNALNLCLVVKLKASKNFSPGLKTHLSKAIFKFTKYALSSIDS